MQHPIGPGALRKFIHEAGRLTDSAGNVDFPLLWAKIQYMERRDLDGMAQGPLPALGPLLDTTTFVRVASLARFWRDDQDQEIPTLDYPAYTVDLLSGFHAIQQELLCLLVSTGREVGLFLGTPQQPGVPAAAQAERITAALQGAFPGIGVHTPPGPALVAAARTYCTGGAVGMLVGPPGTDLDLPGQPAPFPKTERLERVLRGLAGESWAYLVLARPLSEAITGQGLWDALAELTVVSPALRVQTTVNQDQQVETVRREVQYYVEALETLIRRLQIGRSQGLWQVAAYVAAPQKHVVQKALGLLRASLSGPGTNPEPLRSIACAPGSTPRDLTSLLTSRELGAMLQLPRQEVPGYTIREFARFDVDAPVSPPGMSLEIGTIQDGSRDTGQPFGVPLAALPRHALICGVTGSGKTTTAFHILNSLWNAGRGVPFLVIEPAKTEYRELLNAPDLAKHLHIYTLGDERWAGFRLNPFMFEWRPDGSGIHVQTHIDYLRSLFNACFVLYAPMPYVLEVALHEIYEDKGWDLTTSQNRRLPPAVLHNPAALANLQRFLYPTLSQLYDKIDSVVDALGYEERIRMDVQAGLKARIHSLRVGGKGRMLDTAQGVALGDLLAQPAVLELQAIGDDDEKAFLIGLLLTRLYEYRHVESGHQPGTGLVHITLIEEAHRLLANISTEVGSETANVRGKSVETFTNMLAEIRAYGEGVLIAEQIPSRLAPG